MTLKTRPLKGNLGAEVIGLDLSKPLSDAQREELNQLWLDKGVLLFREQQVDPNHQIEFSRTFGELELHPLKEIRSKTYPELIELNTQDELRNPVAYYDGEPFIGRIGWHKDLIYAAQPNRGALLQAVILPEKYGQTGFGDQGLAYDALPESTKKRIDDLEVIYRFDVYLPDMKFLDTSNFEPGPNAPRKPADVGFPDFPDSLYPLVLRHPLNGRKILNVCPMFLHAIHEMPRDEGDALLHELVAHVTRDEFTYLHDWTEGDLIMWDNWRMMHCAMGTNPGMHRKIHRTTIKGDAVLGKPMAA